MQKNCEQTGEVYGYRMEAYKVAANTVRVGTTTMRNWVREFETQEFINDSKRGNIPRLRVPFLWIYNSEKNSGLMLSKPAVNKVYPLYRNRRIRYIFYDVNREFIIVKTPTQ